jgi:hypothetical protein
MLAHALPRALPHSLRAVSWTNLSLQMFRWWRACSTTPGELSTTDPAPCTDMHRHHHRPTATVPSRILAASLQTTHARQNSRPSALGTGYWVPQCGRTRLSARHRHRRTAATWHGSRNSSSRARCPTRCRTWPTARPSSRCNITQIPCNMQHATCSR